MCALVAGRGSCRPASAIPDVPGLVPGALKAVLGYVVLLDAENVRASFPAE